ncbi:iron-sulfur cluster repair di-iron protein [Flavobacterium sp. DGU11]|uniref:Iron-sulfur cluster repair di-iron protein n=1 Tax=Flavobacterium arundinis TaxID=3139143 RepID=A0ABU9HUK0_9FLAO
MTVDTKITIGEIVAEDFRTASVFSKYGIDFCCKGNRTLEEACEKKNITVEQLTEELSNVANASAGTTDYLSWPSDLLIDYIEKKHHRYIEEKTPVLLQYLNKLCKVHGERHPELFRINELFLQSAQDLAAHMKKEELILFPFIKKMLKAKQTGEPIEMPHFGTVENPVAMMKDEHTTEGERFEAIAQLTDNYNAPADACSTYKVTFAMLQEFEQDLHTHIHLENNILFPRAIAMEKELEN